LTLSIIKICLCYKNLITYSRTHPLHWFCWSKCWMHSLVVFQISFQNPECFLKTQLDAQISIQSLFKNLWNDNHVQQQTPITSQSNRVLNFISKALYFSKPNWKPTNLKPKFKMEIFFLKLSNDKSCATKKINNIDDDNNDNITNNVQ
jgi:hypothetical protein